MSVRSTPVRVLLVDDEPLSRTVVAAQLEALGHEVVTADDVASALVAASGEQPDVVLLDMELPDGSGLDVLDALQADEVLATTPVVFLTARHDVSDVARALRRGAHDYLRKPADEVELAARVASAARVARLQAQLRRVARTDELTGLPNRRAALHSLSQASSASSRWQLPLTAMVVDVDRFKDVNDAHGHAAGDAVLVEVARRLELTVRVEDLCARWGGEEFLVIMLGVGHDGARLAAERLRRSVGGSPVRVDDRVSLPVTASVGVSVGIAAAAELLVHRADEALYRAKSAGRDRVVLHEGLVPRQAVPADG